MRPRFFVPDNLYVIGTLNLADRSLSPAGLCPAPPLRLRGAGAAVWRAATAASGGPAGARSLIEQLCTRMAALNQAIADDPELGPDFRHRPQLLLPAARRPEQPKRGCA